MAGLYAHMYLPTYLPTYLYNSKLSALAVPAMASSRGQVDSDALAALISLQAGVPGGRSGPIYIYLSVYLSTFICLSIYVSIQSDALAFDTRRCSGWAKRANIYRCICFPTYIYLSVCLSVYLSIHPSVTRHWAGCRPSLRARRKGDGNRHCNRHVYITLGRLPSLLARSTQGPAAPAQDRSARARPGPGRGGGG